ncbi:MAG: filamentous hemagglutinin N-terminal domain-containing protein, partial [Fusobacteriales bacterium]|nr:filamentous hemagglutinin N-terminal domain-containing protein [Fusobacteriales bacterium]
MKERKLRKVLEVWLLINVLAGIGYADIKVDKGVPQNTSVYKAQNGANIININTPNSKGISVNDYSEFRTKDPTVFNNFGSGVGRSYLAGMMAANPNLTKEQAARVILNRVGGNNRAEIENWLEVMSHNKTDTIISSTNGFYINNTGFINFNKVVFTTSKVYLDGNGEIQPFNIRGGRIEVGREGINAEGLQYLALLSKQISIDGIISAKDGDLDIIAGDFDYNPRTREYVNKASYNGEMLISASAYGSMYGNQIKIVANGGDLGVKSDMIGYKVLAINADGTVRTNQVQGNSEVNIKAKEYIQEGSTYTDGNLNISAEKITLTGAGMQGADINITGRLDNRSNIYAKGNILLGNDTLNIGQIITEKGLTISGNLNTSNKVYGKDLINISGNLFNVSDIQSEGNITIGLNTVNKGRILTDNILHINGTTVNEGTLYGKNKVIVQDLTNSGSVQSTGEITAGNVVNTGKLTGEGSIRVSNLDNQNELVTNKVLTTDNLVNAGSINTGEGINAYGNVINHEELNTNGDFQILGNLHNYNLLNVGGTLNTRDFINYGILRAVNSLETKGMTFYNQGEVLTTALDVDNVNIQNVNKITVIETAKLKGGNILNSGLLSGTNVEFQTSSLTNSSTILAEGIISAQNTSLNNTGYIGSNQKIILSESNILNRGSMESNVIELYNLSGYNNIGGSIKGTGIYLTT